jgi:hypothetical protein
VFSSSKTFDPELIAALSEVISKFERQISSYPLTILAELKESLGKHASQLESPDCRIAYLESNLAKGHTDLSE